MKAFLCGSFNPLHEGHKGLRQAAEEFLGVQVSYMISTVNCDKGRLTEEEAQKRIEQDWDAPLFFTAYPNFADMVEGYNCPITFVMGFDTAERVLNPYYYHDINDELTLFRDGGHKFLVAMRDGKHIGDLHVPDYLEGVFVELPSELWSGMDISSTKIREALDNGERHATM